MGDLPTGGAAADFMADSLHSASFDDPNPLEIFEENWAAAERWTREIIRKVQATSVSEERRRKVVSYIQRLLRKSLGVEVFPYGSVPLKTYLPDGDIDLTAFGGVNIEDTLADDIKSVLEEEENNMYSEFVVKDVQMINAEVKLVKCIVQDIVVDISFNQIGGLCTLCFLEQVDRVIGKDNLFKRSIILIKAWCYYESRILGAHHGLISTYALETLVLYIFNVFHSMLDGPLAVLYKFLDYFSKFDWDSYCVSLSGPARLSSLPSIVAQMPEDGDKDLLLSIDFLSSCVGMFSVPWRVGDRTSRGFQLKHLNILDPLKEFNNLGRSVSKGNFYRIRSAFSYGARKLKQILLQPENSIPNELHKFFSNTMARHGGGQRPDVQDFDPSLVSRRLISGVQTDKLNGVSLHPISTADSHSTSDSSPQDTLQEREGTSSHMADREQCSNLVVKQPATWLDRNQPSKINYMDPQSQVDSSNAVTTGLGALKISTGSSECQTPLLNQHVGAVIKPFKFHDGSKRDVNQDLDKTYKIENNGSSSISCGSDEGEVSAVGNQEEKQLVDCDETVATIKPVVYGSSNSGDPNQLDMEESEIPESLTGDYEAYLHFLRCCGGLYAYRLDMQPIHIPHLPPLTPYQNGSIWGDGLLPQSHFKRNGFSRGHPNGFHPNAAIYAVRPVVLPGVTFVWDEVPKPRGTGTYFPNMNHPPKGYRPSAATKPRNPAPSRSPFNNVPNLIFQPHVIDRITQELSVPPTTVDRSPMVSSYDTHLSFSGNASSESIQPEEVDESESGEKGRLLLPTTLSGTQPPLSREEHNR